LETTETDPGVYVVSAHGPVDERLVRELRDALLPLAAADGSSVVLDLGNAHGIDDATLDVVARAAHLVRRRGERLCVVTHNRRVVESAGESGLAELVSFCDSVREALDGG
jgi:anti-anti-sigma factor